MSKWVEITLSGMTCKNHSTIKRIWITYLLCYSNDFPKTVYPKPTKNMIPREVKTFLIYIMCVCVCVRGFIWKISYTTFLTSITCRAHSVHWLLFASKLDFKFSLKNWPLCTSRWYIWIFNFVMFEFMYCRYCCVNVLNVLYCVFCKNLLNPKGWELDWNILPNYGFHIYTTFQFLLFWTATRQHAGAIITSGSSLNLDHQGMCTWSISDPGSLSGICVCARSKCYEWLWSLITPQRSFFFLCHLSSIKHTKC